MAVISFLVAAEHVFLDGQWVKKNQYFKINTCDIQLLNAQVPLPSFTCVAQILFRNNKLFPNLEGEGVKDKIYFMHKSHVTVKYNISIMMSLNQNLKIIMNAIGLLGTEGRALGLRSNWC